MIAAPAPDSHARLMDGIYRHQRHIYDATRKFYLLGRDRLIKRLDVPEGGSVLELGCGTGRNLMVAARAYPSARFYGLDISDEMLTTARLKIRREHSDDVIAVAQGDATAFDPLALFGRASFERVYLSYALSMIPQWEKAIAMALSVVAPGGSLHMVDFGRQEDLPGWFRAGLRGWLDRFHVTPRDSLRDAAESECERLNASCEFETLFRGYAIHAVIRLPASAEPRPRKPRRPSKQPRQAPAAYMPASSD
ncbi:S-adenosylmethionine-diacylgycerolhomoserine-N-methyltransferase [Mesorhizobium sp. J18]|uniref:class I SAM-dependent methyltransferase n=1 Tax=Mesorhizobium sp. J18 TaxID=935263 RepID=UPI00119A1989|nr:class I SAM-dependent methyltransferase [Mesorhizobium sp. J18]TWH01021.1 S-adenosylmethionine-diacylgycerolhomoserine-N-methyltransferase [Mesorhizobium sp. J18]